MANQAKIIWQGVALCAAFFGTAALDAQAQQKTPYWASIEESEARMRTGPSTEFPVKWVYKRQNLPVKVVAVHSVWRKVARALASGVSAHSRLANASRGCGRRTSSAASRTSARGGW